MERAVGKDRVERIITQLSQREKRQIRLLQLQRVRRSLFRIRLMSPMWYGYSLLDGGAEMMYHHDRYFVLFRTVGLYNDGYIFKYKRPTICF